MALSSASIVNESKSEETNTTFDAWQIVHPLDVFGFYLHVRLKGLGFVGGLLSSFAGLSPSPVKMRSHSMKEQVFISNRSWLFFSILQELRE